MAKKKHAKAAKREAPAKSESNSMGWIIAAIVVVVIIAFLVMKGGITPSKTAEKQTAPVKETFTTSTAPEFNQKCVVTGTPTGPTIGIVPGSQVNNNNVITVTFKNAGKSRIDSTYFEFGDLSGVGATGKLVYRKNGESVEPGATINYVVDLNVVSQEMGSAVDTWTMYPAMDGKACKNSRVFVIRENV